MLVGDRECEHDWKLLANDVFYEGSRRIGTRTTWECTRCGEQMAKEIKP